MYLADSKDGTDQGVHAPLANDAEQQQLPLYAMVDKSQKTVAEQPTYQVLHVHINVHTVYEILLNKISPSSATFVLQKNFAD